MPRLGWNASQRFSFWGSSILKKHLLSLVEKQVFTKICGQIFSAPSQCTSLYTIHSVTHIRDSWSWLGVYLGIALGILGIYNKLLWNFANSLSLKNWVLAEGIIFSPECILKGMKYGVSWSNIRKILSLISKHTVLGFGLSLLITLAYSMSLKSLWIHPLFSTMMMLSILISLWT